MLSGRFAAVQVRHAGDNAGKARLRPEQWLLVEWPADQPEPTKYYLSTLPAEATLEALVAAAHQRWRIERDYQDLEQDFGLGHYEGRGWRGFHHHAALSIAAYGFVMTERLSAQSVQPKKHSLQCQAPVLSAHYVPRGRPTRSTPCARLDQEPSPAAES